MRSLIFGLDGCNREALLIHIANFSFINVPDPISGLYPVHLAIKNSNLAALKHLLKWDVDLSVQDPEGNTVHHYAAETSKDIVSVSVPKDCRVRGCAISYVINLF